jgi:hypothetical protein
MIPNDPYHYETIRTNYSINKPYVAVLILTACAMVLCTITFLLWKNRRRK